MPFRFDGSFTAEYACVADVSAGPTGGASREGVLAGTSRRGGTNTRSPLRAYSLAPDRLSVGGGVVPVLPTGSPARGGGPPGAPIGALRPGGGTGAPGRCGGTGPCPGGLPDDCPVPGPGCAPGAGGRCGGAPTCHPGRGPVFGGSGLLPCEGAGPFPVAGRGGGGLFPVYVGLAPPGPGPAPCWSRGLLRKAGPPSRGPVLTSRGPGPTFRGAGPTFRGTWPPSRGAGPFSRGAGALSRWIGPLSRPDGEPPRASGRTDQPDDGPFARSHGAEAGATVSRAGRDSESVVGCDGLSAAGASSFDRGNHPDARFTPDSLSASSARLSSEFTGPNYLHRCPETAWTVDYVTFPTGYPASGPAVIVVGNSSIRGTVAEIGGGSCRLRRSTTTTAAATADTSASPPAMASTCFFCMCTACQFAAGGCHF